MSGRHVFKAAVLAVLCVFAGDARAGDLKDRPDQPAAKASTYTGPKVQLKVKFTPGTYVMNETMVLPLKMKIHMGQQTQPMDMTMTMGVGGGVAISKPTASGEQDVGFTCTAIKTEIAMLGTTMTYDSSGPAAKQTPQLARALKPLVGVKVTLTGKDGKWKNVSEALNTVLGKIGDAAMRKQMRGTWEPFLKEMLTKHWAKMLPPKPVAPGDRWVATINVTTIPVLGDLRFAANCLLRDIRSTAAGKLACIDFVVKAEVTDKEVQAPAGTMPVKMKIDTLQTYMTGTAEFNMDIGLATRVDLRQELTARMSAQGAMAMTMSLEADAKYSNTLRKAPAGKGQAPAR